MGQFDGDVIFQSPTKEFLRLRGSDGAILVEGRVAVTDQETVDAIRQWIKQSRTKILPNGNMTIISGVGAGPTMDAHGKNVTLLA